MMRVLLVVLLLSVYQNANALTESEAASIYSDALIESFDKKLDEILTFDSSENILESKTYKRLISARSFMEHHSSEKVYLPQIDNGDLYNQVVDAINLDADTLIEEEAILKSNETILFPSSTNSGNIVGSRFPDGFWALTFDDGPKRGNTEKVVDELYRSGHKASFFMLVEQVKRFTESAKNVLDAGQELSLHSYTHANLSKASAKELVKEITTAKIDIEDILNRKITFFRLPYGAGMRSANVRNVITKNEMIHVFWNVDSLDWKDKNPESVFSRVVKQMKAARNKGGVILFHDIHASTVKASSLVMDYMTKEAIQTCHLAEFMSYLNGQNQSCIK